MLFISENFIDDQLAMSLYALVVSRMQICAMGSSNHNPLRIIFRSQELRDFPAALLGYFSIIFQRHGLN